MAQHNPQGPNFDPNPPRPQPRPVNVPAEIGGYQIQRVLGSGGMATVYAALQKQPRRTVALKVIKAGVASDAALRRFKREIEILGKLHHPGIAQVYAAGTHDDGGGAVPFFVMEYISNPRTILEFIAAKNLPTRDRLKLFVKICAAVEHGHRNKIIHRDLKPGNILIDEFGEPKIIDFGIAHAAELDVSNQTMHTEPGRLVGTLQYMSPEQLDSAAQDLDARCDVYALGVLLYKMLTGKPPHDLEALPVFEAVRIIREETPRNPSAIKAELRGDLETIILKAMDPDRSRRYRNAGSLGRDVVRYLANKPIHGERAGILHRARLLVARQRTMVLVVAIVVAVLGLALGIILVERMRMRSEKLAHEKQVQQDAAALQQQREQLSKDQTERAAANGHARDANASSFVLQVHTGRVNRLIFAGAKDRLASASSDHSVIVWNLVEQAPLFTISDFKSSVAHLATNADGSLIAACTDDGPIRVVETETGRFTRSIPIEGSAILAMALSPSGDSAALALDDLTLRFVPVAANAPEARVIRSTTGAFSCMAFAHDGRRMAAGSRSGSVQVWDAAGESLYRLATGDSECVAISFDAQDRLILITQDGQASIWRLNGTPAEIQSQQPVTFNALSGGRGSRRTNSSIGKLIDAQFDSTGRFLAVAVQEEIMIWDLIGSTPKPGAPYVGGPVVIGSPLQPRDTPVSVSIDKDVQWCAVGLQNGDIEMLPIPR